MKKKRKIVPSPAVKMLAVCFDMAAAVREHNIAAIEDILKAGDSLFKQDHYVKGPIPLSKTDADYLRLSFRKMAKKMIPNGLPAPMANQLSREILDLAVKTGIVKTSI